MATLAAFVASQIPASLRMGRDFTGNRGWVDLANQVMNRLQLEGMFKRTRKVERGVEVSNHYWITIPDDLVEVVEIYYPPITEYTERDVTYKYDIVNGKIKLKVPFDKDDDPDTFTLSSGSTTQITIDDDDADENEWEDYLLVPTNGTYQDPIIIGEHDEASGGVTVLDFMHTQDNAIDSTAGYLTSEYLMISYMKSWTRFTAQTDEIPLITAMEDIFRWGLCYLATPTNDKQNFRMYFDLYEKAIEDHGKITFTPTHDQARAEPRHMAAFLNCDEYDDSDSEYIGDD